MVRHADVRLAPRLLPGVLLGEPSVRHAHALALEEAGRWDDAVRLAIAWRVVPVLRRAATLDLPMPHRAHERLTQAYRVAAASSTLVAHQGALVAEALAGAQVRSALFKGVGAIAAVYGSPAERTVSDVDVLVDESDAAAAAAVLTESGFVPDAPRDARGFANVARFRLPNRAVVYRREDVEIDLHTRLGSTGTERLAAGHLLARRRSASLLGRTVHVLHPVDAVLATVHHSLRDRFSPTSTIKDLADLAVELGHLDDGRLQALPDAADAAALRVPLASMTIVLLRLGHEHADRYADVLVRPLTAADRRQAGRLADLVDHQLRHGELSRGLIELLSPQRIHFFRRLVPRRNRRSVPRQTDRSGASTPAAGLVRLSRDGVNPFALARYRALTRAQKGFRS